MSLIYTKNEFIFSIIRFSLLEIFVYWIGLRCRFKAKWPHVGPEPTSGVKSFGGISNKSKPIFKRVLEKTTENIEGLGGKTQPGIEPVTSCLRVLRTEAFGIRRGLLFTATNSRWEKSEIKFSFLTKFQNLDMVHEL